jgi:hypothetical protein
LILAGAAFVVAGALAAGFIVTGRTILPLCVRLTLGGAIYSLCVFLLLTVHAGYLAVWLACGALLFGSVLIGIYRERLRDQSPAVRLSSLPWFYRLLFTGYGLMYLVFALAPEIQADAVTYHLRLVSEYARLHTFSNRLTFFDLLPQGMEMLFVPAFAIGSYSAAKLVHFAFLLATIPLIRQVCRELGLSDGIGCAAAAIFFVAPVCGVSGTSAYTDGGLVCCCLSVFYLLIRWNRERTHSLLIAAALISGFAYTIKQTFGWLAIAAVTFVIVRSREFLLAGLFTISALVSALPWILRAWIVAGNPFAPFLNAWFPNEVSTPAVERALMRTYSAFRPSFHWSSALLDYTVRGGNQGLMGPAFLLVPLALLAMRTRAGRCLLTAAGVLAIPLLANTGTRFLMPAMAPAAIALASILPAPAAFVVVSAQAIGSLPGVLALYEHRGDWRLGSIPWRAALREESERAYLSRSIENFGISRMIGDNTREGARIFSLISVPDAYIPRELLLYWHSALGERAVDALSLAQSSYGSQAMLVSCNWLPSQYRSLRVTADSRMRILEASLNRGGAVVNSWKPYLPGDSLRLPISRDVTAADLLIWPGTSGSATIRVQAEKGGWRNLGDSAQIRHLPLDLRRDATAWLRREGFEYILARVSQDAWSSLARDMLRHPNEWGLEAISPWRDYWLFYIDPL